jgi:hypothetical protein
MQNLCPEFLLHLQKQCEDSVMMLPSSQEATLMRKVNHILIQAEQTCQGRPHLILACPCKSKHRSQRHREAYIGTYISATHNTRNQNREGQ